MSSKGFVQNGVVVFAEPVRLASGTEVRAEPVAAARTTFWEPPSLDELAHRQGVSVQHNRRKSPAWLMCCT